MAGTITPKYVEEYTAKASPSQSFTALDDNGNAIDLTGATLTGYLLSVLDSSVTALRGAFAIANQNTNKGQFTYQWTLIDVNSPGGWQLSINAKLSAEPYTRTFHPVLFIVLPTPEWIAHMTIQEVDLNVNGAPNTSSNPTYTDIIDRIARILGHVIVDSMPAVTGTITPQVGGSNVSTSNPLPVTSGQVGPVAQWGSNPSVTNAGSETLIKFGSSGTSTVQRISIDNETGADVRYALDKTATANSTRLKDGNVLYLAQPVTVLHLYTVGAQNINQANGIIIEVYN